MLPGRKTMSQPEVFTPEEEARLAPYFTNTDAHVFALTSLPETVKGALFARYSRSAKSLRRLFLDEFADKVSPDTTAAAAAPTGTAVERAERLYARVFNEYGDDSVAQLGGAHIACEYVSNVLTKVLEWGRLMSYLEQSTRYVPYTDKLHGRWRYHVPSELGSGALHDEYLRTMDRTFEVYAAWIPRMQDHFAARHPRSPGASDAVHRRKRWTRCADCCPRQRNRTSGSSEAARPSRRCCCACRRIRSRKSVSAPGAC